MAEITKQALKVDNNTSFPNNNNGAITPSILRAFNTNMIDSLVDEVGYTLDSGSWNQQIDALEQFTASASGLTTGSLLITASAVSNVITFTKGNGTTFNVTVADTTDLSQLNQATASLQAFTASANIRLNNLETTTASLNSSVTQLNANTASQQVSINNLNTTTASLLVETQNLELFSASALISITNLNQSSASQQTQINSLIAATGSYATTGSNTFVGANTFTSISASSFISASEFIGNGSKITGITASISMPILDEGIPQGNAFSLNFTGSGISAIVVGGTAVISVNTPDSGTINNLTASFNAYTSSTDAKFLAVQASTASLNSFTASFNSNTFVGTASFNSYTSSQDTKNSTLASVTSSLNTSASLALVTASFSGNTLTFTKGNGTTFGVVIPDVSGSTGNFATTGSNTFVGNQTITGSLFISGNINMVNGADIVTHHVRAQGSNGLELQTSAGTIIVAMGQGGGTQAGFVGAVTANSISASTINGLGDPLAFSTSVDSRLDSLEGVSGSYATTGSNSFNGNQRITGSLTISSSATNDLIVIGRQVITGSTGFETCRTSLDNTSVFIDTTRDDNTGALITAYASAGSQGASLTLGVYDQPNFNTDIELNINVDTGSGIVFKDFDNVSAFDYVPFMSVAPNLGNNPTPLMTRGLQVTGSTQVQNFTASLQNGYAWVGNSLGQNTQVATSSFVSTINTGSFATTGSNSFNGNQTISGSLLVSGSATTDVTVVGKMVISGPTTAGQTPTLIITGSDNAFTLIGRFFNNINSAQVNGVLDTFGQIYANTASVAGQYIGVYDDPNFNTVVEIATEVTKDGISFKDYDNVSAFGYIPFLTIAPNLGNNPSPVMTRGLQVTGSTQVQNFTASLQQGYVYVGNASGITTTVATSSFVTNVSNLATTGSNSFNGNQTITGSLIMSSSNAVELTVIGNMVVTGSAFGNVVSMSIASSTASMNLNTGNYFTLSIPTGTTRISPSNIQPGTSATLVITTASGSLVTFDSSVKQPSGSAYVPTSGSVDVLSFVSVNSSSLYVVSTKNMI